MPTSASPRTIDQQMEVATAALMDMRYAEAAQRCESALQQARAAGDWELYARVLLPLQEARRQQRMIAADAGARLGTAEPVDQLAALLHGGTAGCVLLTRPTTADQAQALRQQADAAGLTVQVLWAGHEPGASRWRLGTTDASRVVAQLPAPPAEAVGRWCPGETCGAVAWFLKAHEALGDAALAAVTDPPGTLARVKALESAVAAVGDHEILHQRLADAARAMGPRAASAAASVSGSRPGHP
jgi:hypothetical protein